MIRAGLLALAALLLTGCGRWADLDSGAFAPGKAPFARFSTDAQSCALAAEQQRSWSVAGLSQDQVGRHRLYNRAYAACMEARGYRPRAEGLDFLERYDL